MERLVHGHRIWWDIEIRASTSDRVELTEDLTVLWLLTPWIEIEGHFDVVSDGLTDRVIVNVPDNLGSG